MTRAFTMPVAANQSLRRREPLLWINDARRSINEARPALPFTLDHVREAERELGRCASLLAKLFPELMHTGGIIESALKPAVKWQRVLTGNTPARGQWLIKCDHALPVAGSIKARGGIYEILVHAGQLARRAGLIRRETERLALASPELHKFFSRHRVAVGSTGNLGLSIGLMASALGFQAVVHMSSDAKSWKKERLCMRGVSVIEHEGDYRAAVAAGRAQAAEELNIHFVDDENSEHLFLGYSVAALRLQRQLAERSLTIDETHPLFVYLPCGVGGAPGGITFALRLLFGDHVHCFFAEPVSSPCMLIRLAVVDNKPISVRDVGLDNRTEADGLAVGQASEFVAPIMRALVSGIFTVADEDLFKDLYALEQSEGIRIEPSAAAALRGPRWLLESEAGQDYLQRHGLQNFIGNAAHILWTTGGALVPTEEYLDFHARGQREQTS